MTGKCCKGEVVAIIENNGCYWIGSNACENAQKKCPRGKMPTGQGYEMCENICKQFAHAEEMACYEAGKEAIGGTLYLIGHTYCCDNCKKIMKAHGIEKVVIGKLPPSWRLK